MSDVSIKALVWSARRLRDAEIVRLPFGTRNSSKQRRRESGAPSSCTSLVLSLLACRQSPSIIAFIAQTKACTTTSAGGVDTPELSPTALSRTPSFPPPPVADGQRGDARCLRSVTTTESFHHQRPPATARLAIHPARRVASALVINLEAALQCLARREHSASPSPSIRDILHLHVFNPRPPASRHLKSCPRAARPQARRRGSPHRRCALAQAVGVRIGDAAC